MQLLVTRGNKYKCNDLRSLLQKKKKFIAQQKKKCKKMCINANLLKDKYVYV